VAVSVVAEADRRGHHGRPVPALTARRHLMPAQMTTGAFLPLGWPTVASRPAASRPAERQRAQAPTPQAQPWVPASRPAGFSARTRRPPIQLPVLKT